MEQILTLGKRIAALRKEKGMTQEQLAEKVGVSAQAVSKWENDASCPDITLLPLLSDILGASVDELLGVKPVEPHVIIIDKEENPPEKSSGSRNFKWEWHAGKWSTIAFCIGLILICLVFIARSALPGLRVKRDQAQRMGLCLAAARLHPRPHQRPQRGHLRLRAAGRRRL